MESVGILETTPLAGMLSEVLENLSLDQYRQILSVMNRIIYEVRQDTIYIHVVCDTRRDMRTLLMERGCGWAECMASSSQFKRAWVVRVAWRRPKAESGITWTGKCSKKGQESLSRTRCVPPGYPFFRLWF